MKYFKCTTLLFVILSDISASVQYRSFHAHVTLRNDRRLAAHAVTTISVSSAIQCASLCAGNPSCKSFNVGPAVCELLDSYYCESPFNVVAEAGFSYVDIDEDVGDGVIQNTLSSDVCIKHNRCSIKCASHSQNVGQPCADSSSCIIPNTECRDGICQCEILYAYSQENDTCVSECATYSSSFSHKDNWTLRGFNDGAFRDVDNVMVCLEHCKQMEGCRSVEYSPSDRVCYVSVSSCYSHQDQCGTNPYFNFYIRNCI